MATQNNSDLLELVDEATMKLTHASAIIDLIRSAGAAETREHTLTEASDAALVLIDEAQEFMRRIGRD